MKKKVIIISAIIVLILLGYKTMNYVYYTKNISKLKNHLEINDTITINLKETNDEYLEFKNIKIRNDFKDFELLDFGNNDVKKYVLKKNNETFAAFELGFSEDYFINLIKDMNLGTKTNKRVILKLLEKNNINDDVELLKFINDYLDSHKDDKISFFTSVKQMRENYAVKFLVSQIIPNTSGISLISGDNKGYIFNFENVNNFVSKEVHILKENKSYVFTFVNNDYFTDDKIIELLETVVID